MWWVRITDSVGITWHSYISKTDAAAYARCAEGELFRDAPEDIRAEQIEIAVSKYLKKKNKHIIL